MSFYFYFTFLDPETYGHFRDPPIRIRIKTFADPKHCQKLMLTYELCIGISRREENSSKRKSKTKLSNAIFKTEETYSHKSMNPHYSKTIPHSLVRQYGIPWLR